MRSHEVFTICMQRLSLLHAEVPWYIRAAISCSLSHEAYAKIIEVRRFAVERVEGYIFFSADQDREVPVLQTFSGKRRMSVRDENVRTRVSRIVFIGFSMDSYIHIHDHILRSQYGVWAKFHMANHKYGGDMEALIDHIPSISGLRWHNNIQNISFRALFGGFREYENISEIYFRKFISYLYSYAPRNALRSVSNQFITLFRRQFEITFQFWSDL